MMRKSTFPSWLLIAVGLSLCPGLARSQFLSQAYYRLVAVHSGLSLDVSASATTQANLIQAPASASESQHWQLVDTGGGYYKLLAEHSGLAMDVGSASQLNGAAVQQYADNGSDAQRWLIEAVAGGYKLTAKHSGQVLQVANGALEAGAAVQQGIDQHCVVLATTPGAAGALSTLRSAVVYPVPADEYVAVRLASAGKGAVGVTLTDLLGRTVVREPLAASGRVMVGYLASGAYVLTLSQGSEQVSHRLLVEHGGPAARPQGPSVPTAAPGQAQATLSACGQVWRIVLANEEVNLATYRELANNYSLAAGMRYRYGRAPLPFSNNGFPTLYKPADHFFDNNGNGNGNGWHWQVGGPVDPAKNDYFTNQGQVLYVADNNAADAGVTALQVLLMGSNVFGEKPELPWPYYGGGSPDPDILRSEYEAANGGPLRRPTAIGRSYGISGWASNDLVAFQSGLIAACGTNTSRGAVALKLPAYKVPTAVALTSNNEFALVTVWDTNLLRGQVAVLALGTGNGTSFWGDWTAVYPGLRNMGLFSFVKLLGYVDLPGMTQPIEISTSTDYAASSDPIQGWFHSPDGTSGRYEAAQLPLNNETNRQSFITGPNRDSYSKSGFAVISSKAERKVIFLDLKPLFERFRTMYFTSRSNFDLTQHVGQQPDEWPYTFAVTPNAAPTVIKTVTMPHLPTAVRTSLVPGVNQAYVATQDGILHLFSVGGYGTSAGGSPADITEVGSVAVGANPTSIAYYKNKASAPLVLANNLIVAVRGERAIKWVHLTNNVGSVTKIMRDTRLIDPVWVEDNDNHGTEAAVVTVADYGGRQVIDYRYGPVIFHTNGGERFDMGPTGQDEYECGGFYPTAGFPFQFSGNNVP